MDRETYEYMMYGMHGGADLDNIEMIEFPSTYTPDPNPIISKTSNWIREVKSIQKELGISYKEALKEASRRRKQGDSTYKTSAQRYRENLDSRRQSDRGYRAYGKKNKRPVSLATARKLLVDYYRQKSNGTIRGLRKDISSKHKSAKRTLKPGARDSWKYRPGTNSKSVSGPGYYDMEGLDDGRKGSSLYKKKSLIKRKYTKKDKTKNQYGGVQNEKIVGGSRCGARTQSGGSCRNHAQAQYGGSCRLHK